VKGPSPTFSNVTDPSGPVVPLATISSPLRISTEASGRPTSPSSNWPTVPPPGLKSRHTTTAIPSAGALGAAAWTASVGTSGSAIAVRPIWATEPASKDPLATIAPPSSVRSEPGGTTASGYSPGGLTASTTAPTVALTNPLSGAGSYITRQITPVARNEIAIGMNTTILIAV
jgi:hypothetical protein